MNAELTKEELQAELQRLYEDMFSAGLRVETVVTNGELIPINQWLTGVQEHQFVDYDGYGRFAMHRVDHAVMLINLIVYPTTITKFNVKPPKWATHVVWYNR